MPIVFETILGAADRMAASLPVNIFVRCAFVREIKQLWLRCGSVHGFERPGDPINGTTG